VDDFLLRLALDVKVLAPIHVGTGEKLSTKSFVVEHDELVVADEQKLIAWATANPQRESGFMAFAETLDKSLGDFLRDYHLTPADYAGYRMTYDTPGRPRDVMVFIKTGGVRPYLPGSSFKGAVRSALLRGVVVSQPAVAQGLRTTVEPLVDHGDRHASDELQARVFVPAKGVRPGKRPNYDLIRALGFSDSDVLSPARLQVYEVRVLSAQTNHRLSFKLTPRGNNLMQIYVEALKPGTTLHLSATINEGLLDRAGPARDLQFGTRDALVRGFAGFCRLSAANLIEQEIAFYRAHQQNDMEQWFVDRKAELEGLPEGAFLLPVGWGTGYDAKTVTDQLGEEVMRAVVQNYRNTRRLGKPGGSGPWLGLELSPKTRKVAVHADDHLEPVGWVRVQLREG
jgi:CRISPR-associated protein Csm5